MAAIEAILEVKPRLADHIVGPHQIVVQNSDQQFGFQGEGHSEFKNPERKCKDAASHTQHTPPIRVQWTNAGRKKLLTLQMSG